MSRTPTRAVLVALTTITLLVGATGAAWAVSAGGYDPSQQDCPANATANTAPKGATVPGCHNVAVNVEDGHGKRYAEFGLDQLPTGYSSTPGLIGLGYPDQPNGIHSGCLAANTNGTTGRTGKGCGAGTGTGFALVFNTQDPTGNHLAVETGAPALAGLLSSVETGWQFYFGQDDNTDAGEHDGVSGRPGTAGSVNGPSDGGGAGLHVTPGSATTKPTLSDPVPVAGAHSGFCADGICFELTTQQQNLYNGCGANPTAPCAPGAPNSRNAYDYTGKSWDPQNCSSGDTTSEAPGPQGCGPKTMDQWRAQEARHVTAQPGVQLFEDPDPQSSPVGPYPLPAVYVGTCGVVLGGGTAPAAPSPLTNRASQLVVPLGC